MGKTAYPEESLKELSYTKFVCLLGVSIIVFCMMIQVVQKELDLKHTNKKVES